MKFLSFQAAVIINNLIFFSVSQKKVSWFPPPNIWDTCGYNVGQWTEECEKWFQGHVKSIHSGKFQPASSGEWRTRIRNTRMAVKLTYQMKKGAAGFISAHQDQLSLLY
jgi:hypothetical protein